MEPGANDMFMIVSDTECEGHTKQKVPDSQICQNLYRLGMGRNELTEPRRYGKPDLSGFPGNVVLAGVLEGGQDLISYRPRTECGWQFVRNKSNLIDELTETEAPERRLAFTLFTVAAAAAVRRHSYCVLRTILACLLPSLQNSPILPCFFGAPNTPHQRPRPVMSTSRPTWADASSTRAKLSLF